MNKQDKINALATLISGTYLVEENKIAICVREDIHGNEEIFDPYLNAADNEMVLDVVIADDYDCYIGTAESWGKGGHKKYWKVTFHKMGNFISAIGKDLSSEAKRFAVCEAALKLLEVV